MRKWIIGAVAITASAAAGAKYESQVAYLQNLRAPVDPTAESCQALDQKFRQASAQISHAHDNCLSNSRDSASGTTCTKASCQALHSLMQFAQERAGTEGSLCRQRLAAAATEARRHEEALRQLVASEGRVREAQRRVYEDLSRLREQNAQSAARPNPRSTVSSRERVESTYNHPITQSTIENEKNAIAAAADSGVHDVVPGLTAPAIGSAGSAASAVLGVFIGAGVGALDPDVARGVKVILERSGGRHPADKIMEDDDAQYRPPVSSGCGVLSDPVAKKKLADHDPQRLLHLTYSCPPK